MTKPTHINVYEATGHLTIASAGIHVRPGQKMNGTPGTPLDDILSSLVGRGFKPPVVEPLTTAGAHAEAAAEHAIRAELAKLTDQIMAERRQRADAERAASEAVNDAQRMAQEADEVVSEMRQQVAELSADLTALRATDAERQAEIDQLGFDLDNARERETALKGEIDGATVVKTGFVAISEEELSELRAQAVKPKKTKKTTAKPKKAKPKKKTKAKTK